MSPNLRFAVFVAAGAFFLLGPIETQVFLGPARSARKPWLPMHWHMYHGVGIDFCQANLWYVRDGKRIEYSREALSKAIGKRPPRPKKRNQRFVVQRHARSSDVVLASEGELPDVAKVLCHQESDVRAEMRCSPPLPSGPWRSVEDGSVNLCSRSKWQPPPPPPANQPTLDPDTGEPFEEEPSPLPEVEE